MINESLRLVTPLPFNVRQAVRDTELLGYFIPAGTNINLWPGLNHRLPELWTDPEKFDPDRFAKPRTEHKRHRYAFAPFGGGAHKCIGMVFGQLEVKTVIHRLLRQYRLSCRIRTTGRATTMPACRCRSTVCRSCCARCADQFDALSSKRLAQAMTANSADSVASCAQPIAHWSRWPSPPRTNVAVWSPERSW